jgi:hypothetical protein
MNTPSNAALESVRKRRASLRRLGDVRDESHVTYQEALAILCLTPKARASSPSFQIRPVMARAILRRSPCSRGRFWAAVSISAAAPGT